jgi:hypothetical protein
LGSGSDAFVIPSSSGCAEGRPPARVDHPLVLLQEPELVHLLLGQELGVVHILDLHPPHHLAPRICRVMTSMLSLMFTPCRHVSRITTPAHLPS